MVALAANRERFPKCRCDIKVEDLKNPAAKEVFIALEESFRNEDVDFGCFLARIQDERLRAFVTEKAMGEEFKLNVDKSISDGIRSVRIAGLVRRRDRLMSELARDSFDSGKSSDEVMYEKMHIDSELLKLKETRE